jgi:hypothetical protein
MSGNYRVDKLTAQYIIEKRQNRICHYSRSVNKRRIHFWNMAFVFCETVMVDDAILLHGITRH